MDSFDILLILHFLGVILLSGTIALPFMQGLAERTGVQATRFFLQVARRMDMFLVYPGVALIAIAGVGMIFDDQTGYKDDFPHWMEGAIAWFVLLAILATFVMPRLARKGYEALERATDDNALPVAYMDVSKRIQMVSGLIGLSVIGIMVLMVLGAEGVF